MMLFSPKNCDIINKERLAEDVYAVQYKLMDLEKWFLSKFAGGDAGEYNCLAPTCHQCAEILEECAELVSQMLPSRDKRKARVFEAKARELLVEEKKFLQESWTFEYPITNGTLIAIANDLRSLILEYTAI